jgi:hypothetical protein
MDGSDKAGGRSPGRAGGRKTGSMPGWRSPRLSGLLHRGRLGRRGADRTVGHRNHSGRITRRRAATRVSLRRTLLRLSDGDIGARRRLARKIPAPALPACARVSVRRGAGEVSEPVAGVTAVGRLAVEIAPVELAATVATKALRENAEQPGQGAPRSARRTARIATRITARAGAHFAAARASRAARCRLRRRANLAARRTVAGSGIADRDRLSEGTAEQSLQRAAAAAGCQHARNQAGQEHTFCHSRCHSRTPRGWANGPTGVAAPSGPCWTHCGPRVGRGR